MVAHLGVFRNWRKGIAACWGQSSYTGQHIGLDGGAAQERSLQFFTNRPLRWEWPAWLLSHPFEGDFDIAPKLRGFFSNFDSYRVAASYIDETGATILSKALERGAHIELVMPWTPNVYADGNARKGGVGWGTRASWKRKASKKGLCQKKLSEDFPFLIAFSIRTLGNLLAKWGDSSNFVLKLHSSLVEFWRGKFFEKFYWFNLRNQSREIGTWKQVQAPIASRFQLFTLVLADNFTSRCKAIEEARYSQYFKAISVRHIVLRCLEIFLPSILVSLGLQASKTAWAWNGSAWYMVPKLSMPCMSIGTSTAHETADRGP